MLCAKVHKTIWPVNDVIWKTIRCAHKAQNMNTLLELDVREKRTYDNMLRNTSNTSYLIDWYAYWNWNKWQTIKKGNTMFCTLVSTSWMYNVRRKHDMVHREPKREEKKIENIFASISVRSIGKMLRTSTHRYRRFCSSLHHVTQPYCGLKMHIFVWHSMKNALRYAAKWLILRRYFIKRRTTPSMPFTKWIEREITSTSSQFGKEEEKKNCEEREDKTVFCTCKHFLQFPSKSLDESTAVCLLGLQSISTWFIRQLVCLIAFRLDI